MRLKLPLHHFKEAACELNLNDLWSLRYYPKNTDSACTLCYHMEFAHSICMIYHSALFGARAIILRQYLFNLHFVLSSWVCSFNLCELSSCSLWSSHYYPKTIPVQSMLCTLIWSLLIQSAQSIILLSYELALLS